MNILPSPDAKALWNIWLSYYHFPMLAVAVDLGFFELINEKPQTATAMSQRLHISERACETICGLMVGLGLFSQHQGMLYLTPVSRTYLLKDSPYYWGPMIDLAKMTPISYVNLMEAIVADKPMAYAGEDTWEKHQMSQADAIAFTNAMHCRHLGPAAAVASHGDFTGIKQLLDIGGGSGVFSIAIASALFPHLRCTVLDLPKIIPITRQYIEQTNLARLIETVGADMFTENWPQGHDAVFFGNIFHDWNEQQCQLLVQKSYQLLPKGGRIYIHEMFLNDTKDGPLACISDSAVMLMWTKGKQWSLTELKVLLAKEGFHSLTYVATCDYYGLLTAVK